MEFNIIQEFTKRYITCEKEVSEDEQYLVSMISLNDIRGLLSCKETYDGSKKLMAFDVTNMLSLKHEYENKEMSFLELKSLLQSIKTIFEQAAQYFLDDRYFVLDPQYIYKDPYDDSVKLLYVPGCKCNESLHYHELAEFLLQNVNRKENACLQTAYQFYRMCSSETFSLPMFMNILEKEEKMNRRQICEYDRDGIKDENDLIPTAEIMSEEEDEEDKDDERIWVKPLSFTAISLVLASFTCFYKGIYSMYIMTALCVFALLTVIFTVKSLIRFIEKKKEDSIVMPKQRVTVKDYWPQDEETEIFNEETEVFTPNRDLQDETGIRLEWKENNISKKYMIRDFPVTIGKLIGEVDCRISDSSISRLHAKIAKRNDKLVIFDLNSTNGTSVDGVRLSPGEETVINMESRILLGNVVLRLV